jgi:hypothetical protein
MGTKFRINWDSCRKSRIPQLRLPFVDLRLHIIVIPCGVSISQTFATSIPIALGTSPFTFIGGFSPPYRSQYGRLGACRKLSDVFWS